MKKALLSLFYSWLFLLPLVTAPLPLTLTVEGLPRFVPENFYIGDRVHCLLTVRLPDGVGFHSEPEGALLDRPDLKILSVESAATGSNQYEIDIFFISFLPQNKIPALPMGEITLPEIPVNAFSFLEGESPELEPLRPPVLLPYTVEIIVGLVLLCLFVVVLILLFSKTVRSRWLLFFKNQARSRFSKKVTQTIRMLSMQNRDFSPVVFYSKLTLAVKEYLESALNQNLFFATTGEINRCVETFFRDRRIGAAISELLKAGDEVKFGNRVLLRSQMKHDLVLLKRTVTLIEKEMAARQKEAIQKAKEEQE